MNTFVKMCGQVINLSLQFSFKILIYTLNANILYPAFLFPKGLWNHLHWQVSFDETRRSIQTVCQIGS